MNAEDETALLRSAERHQKRGMADACHWCGDEYPCEVARVLQLAFKLVGYPSPWDELGFFDNIRHADIVEQRRLEL